MPGAGKDVQELELLYPHCRNEKWYSHFEEQFGSFLKRYIYIYHTT